MDQTDNKKPMYKWLLVMKNGKEYFVWHEANTLDDLLIRLMPAQLNELKWTSLDLVNPNDNFTAIAINGADISSIGYRTR